MLYRFSLGALALSGLTGAQNLKKWTYPDCELDNCYRNMIDDRFTKTTPDFCFKFLASKDKYPTIPSDYANCDGNIAAVSSACSCITYTATHTASHSATTSSAVTTTTSVYSTHPHPSPSTTSTWYPESSSKSTRHPDHPTSYTTSSQAYTTSTIYTTKVYTVTSCHPTVTDCPGKPHVTTEVIPVTTTVCPVTETYVKPSDYPHHITSVSTSTYYKTDVYTVTKCPPEVQHCPVGSTSTTVYPTTECFTTVISTLSTKAPTTTPVYSGVASGTGAKPTKTTTYAQVPTGAAGRVEVGAVAAVAGLFAAAML